MARGRLIGVSLVTLIVALSPIVAVAEVPVSPVKATNPEEYGEVRTAATPGAFVDVDPADLAGNGTEADPHIIANASELQAMEDDLNASYRLAADINASGTVAWNDGSGFKPIGTDSNPFTGTFNGSGYAISGLTIDRSDTDGVGLFGDIGSSGLVHDVLVLNVNITGSSRTGGLVGSNDGTVQKVLTSGTVAGAGRVGGLVGNNDGTVRKVSSSSSVASTGSFRYLGGLIGFNRGTVQEASASGAVDGSPIARFVGGLAGYNEGTVRETFASGRVSGSEDVGGLTGYNFGTVEASYWDVDASGRAASAGGTPLETARMTGEAARTNMPSLAFGTVWKPRPDDYPTLIALAAEFEVSNLSAPAQATAGDIITVTATVRNIDNIEGATNVEFVFGGDSLLSQSVTLGAGNATPVTFEVPTEDIQPGTYEHAVRTSGANQTAMISIQQPPTFEISNLEASEETITGDTIIVNATVTNVGDVSGTTGVEFVFDGETLLNQTHTIGAGNMTNVSFEVSTEGIEPGTYEHGVRAGDANQTAEITVQQPATFEISGLEAPTEAVAGATITINVTVTNVGDVEGMTEIKYAGDLLNQTIGSKTSTITRDSDVSAESSLEIPTTDVSPGTYEYSVQVDNKTQRGDIVIQQPAVFDVSDLEASGEVVAGENITVTARVSNTGGVKNTTDVRFVFDGKTLLNQTPTIGAGDGTTVRFEVPTEDIQPGTYEHGVIAGNASQITEIIIQQPATFEVSDLEAPAEAAVGDIITVNATVTNVGDVEGSTNVEFIFAGDSLLSQSVTLSTGNMTTVSFEVSTEDIEPGSYEHGVQAGNTSLTADINIEDSSDPSQTNGTTAPDDAGTDSPGQPGFSIAVAVIALLVVLAVRRRG
jgi:PGF-CTERM protein